MTLPAREQWLGCEDRHELARAVFHGRRGELRQRYQEGQEDQLGTLGLVVNIIVLWNTIYSATMIPTPTTPNDTTSAQRLNRGAFQVIPQAQQFRPGA